MFSTSVWERYAGIPTRTIMEAVRSSMAASEHMSGCRAETPTRRNGNAFYMRAAMIRELTRERDLPSDFIPDAYEWLSDCYATRHVRADRPVWYYALLVERNYEGGLSTYLTDKANWDAYTAERSLGREPYPSENL